MRYSLPSSSAFFMLATIVALMAALGSISSLLPIQWIEILLPPFVTDSALSISVSVTLLSNASTMYGVSSGPAFTSIVWVFPPPFLSTAGSKAISISSSSPPSSSETGSRAISMGRSSPPSSSETACTSGVTPWSAQFHSGSFLTQRCSTSQPPPLVKLVLMIFGISTHARASMILMSTSTIAPR